MNREIGGHQSKVVYLPIQGTFSIKGTFEKFSLPLVKDGFKIFSDLLSTDSFVKYSRNELLQK